MEVDKDAERLDAVTKRHREQRLHGMDDLKQVHSDRAWAIDRIRALEAEAEAFDKTAGMEAKRADQAQQAHRLAMSNLADAKEEARACAKNRHMLVQQRDTAQAALERVKDWLVDDEVSPAARIKRSVIVIDKVLLSAPAGAEHDLDENDRCRRCGVKPSKFDRPIACPPEQPDREPCDHGAAFGVFIEGKLFCRVCDEPAPACPDCRHSAHEGECIVPCGCPSRRDEE